MENFYDSITCFLAASGIVFMVAGFFENEESVLIISILLFFISLTSMFIQLIKAYNLKDTGNERRPLGIQQTEKKEEQIPITAYVLPICTAIIMIGFGAARISNPAESALLAFGLLAVLLFINLYLFKSHRYLAWSFLLSGIVLLSVGISNDYPTLATLGVVFYFICNICSLAAPPGELVDGSWWEWFECVTWMVHYVGTSAAAIAIGVMHLKTPWGITMLVTGAICITIMLVMHYHSSSRADAANLQAGLRPHAHYGWETSYPPGSGYRSQYRYQYTTWH